MYKGYTVSLQKKKDLFCWAERQVTYTCFGWFRGGPRGPHLLFFRWNFVLILWGIFIKIKFQVSLSRLRLPFLNFLDLPLFVWATFDFDFSKRFSVNCQNLCCQSTDSQSSVVISLGAICLHHLTIENEIRWKFCRIFTLHGYFWECKNGYFCSIQLTSLTLTALD